MRTEDVMEKYFPMNLQLFGHGGVGGDGGNAGGDDPDGGKGKPDEDGNDGDSDGENDENPSEEKKYTEAEMESAVQKRFAREKRKWQREHQKKPSAGSDKEDKDPEDDGDSEAEKKVRKAEEKATSLEMKWTCLEHDVKKDCVDDVLALARVHMTKDKDMDIEDAIDAVIKKYPQFKDGYESDGDEDAQDKKSWGQRHGKPPAKAATVEDEIRKQMFGK